MARKSKGGNRYKRVVISLPKRLYYVLNGIAMGDERKLNRLIKGILEDKLNEATLAELEVYLGRVEEDEDELIPEIELENIEDSETTQEKLQE